jgi:3-oxosteroid 1-dehydrogenase
MNSKPLVETFDFIVVGSGAGSVAAALAIKRAGKRPLIIESTDKFGGSTSLSGGLIWIPNNHVMQRRGIRDSLEQASEYLEACSAGAGVAASPERRSAFLKAAPVVTKWLEDLGMRWTYPEGYSDYHESEYPGATASGRALEAKPFDLNRLGAWQSRIRQHPGDVPITAPELGKLSLVGSLASYSTMAKVGWRVTLNKLGKTIRCRGNSLQGRLLEIALREKIEIWLECALTDIIMSDGRAVGIEADKNGQQVRLMARDGVLLNGGGFSHNREMRNTYQPALSSTDYSAANPGDVGTVIRAATKIGAAIDLMDLSWWVPLSIVGPGIFAFHVPNDTAKPHCIIVDSRGNRYVCEATSYVAVGIAMFERARVAPDVPSWLVVDSQFMSKYRWGAGVFPSGKPPEDWITSGYMKRAETISGLAALCDISPDKLTGTVERFNSYCQTGVDADFAKGASAYHRFFGDPKMKGNPCLGKLDMPPFYAVRLLPGDVGTAGGLLTDEHARVLTVEGGTIAGLYATGNATAAVVGRSYPGAGASIGAALTFAYIAAGHALGKDPTGS